MDKRTVFNNRWLPLLLLLPQLAITLVFFYWPASQAVWSSFRIEDAFGTSTEFVGLENYQVLFANPAYYKAMGTTLMGPASMSAVMVSTGVRCAPARTSQRPCVHTHRPAMQSASSPSTSASPAGFQGFGAAADTRYL
jgi:ABC-type sugar transport system permease subunit